MRYSGDIDLELPSDHLWVTNAFTNLKMAGLGSLFSDDVLKKMIQNGPDADCDEDTKRKVQAERSRMKKFLYVSFPHTVPTEESGDVLTIDTGDFPVTHVRVTSKAGLRAEVTKFLDSDQDVGMPVIVVEGPARVENSLLLLDFGDTTEPALPLLGAARKRFARLDNTDDLDSLRMVFNCRDNSGLQLLYTNAVPWEVFDANHLELNMYAYTIIGDSEHNTTGIVSEDHND